jgi:AmmeMemoRadiSam system protein A
MGGTSTITTTEGRPLLLLAREAMEAFILTGDLPVLELTELPPLLRAPGASFVTLTKHGALRGCIGTIEARLPLAEDVRRRAVDAATRDYRFPPVCAQELALIRIEVSVLSAPEPLSYRNPQEIPHLLRPGTDGVVLVSGMRRSTFLPQVWERVPEPERFLQMLCQKAGLASDAWRHESLHLLTYQVHSFCEGDNAESAD